MSQPRKNGFVSPSMGLVSYRKMISEISDFIEDEPDSYYRLVIGTDSQGKRLNGKFQTDYVTAVIIHRRGRGARYFWRKEKVERKPVLREKIYQETLRSLDTAQELVPSLRKTVSASKYDLEIHIDVGPLGPTREMIKEVVGMVNGSGFTAKTKPASWGASTVADKHA